MNYRLCAYGLLTKGINMGHYVMLYLFFSLIGNVVIYIRNIFLHLVYLRLFYRQPHFHFALGKGNP